MYKSSYKSEGELEGHMFWKSSEYEQKQTGNLLNICVYTWDSLVVQTIKSLPVVQDTGFDPWVKKIPWRREWQPTPVFLPVESHGQRSLAGYSLWG